MCGVALIVDFLFNLPLSISQHNNAPSMFDSLFFSLSLMVGAYQDDAFLFAKRWDYSAQTTVLTTSTSGWQPSMLSEAMVKV